jgi:branched-chain amino acid transport system substrate-binding protein
MKAKVLGAMFAVGMVVCCAVKSQEVALIKVVKIGHVAPLTGALANLGKDNERGFLLAIEDLNAMKLRIGGQEIRFEGVSLDDGADPKRGTMAAQKLVDARVSGVIGHLNSGTTIPAAPIYHGASVVQITPSATNPKFTAMGLNTSFRTIAHDGQLGYVAGKYAMLALLAKSIVVVDDRTAYGQGVATEFERAVLALGGELQAREFTNDRATDFTAIIQKLGTQQPDLIFFGGMDSTAARFLRQINQAGLVARFLGPDGICTNEFARMVGDAYLDGQVICFETGGTQSDRVSAMAEWSQRFRVRFNAPVQLYAPYVYDATMVMAAAMQKANSTDPTVYRPFMNDLIHEGLTGLISFESNGDLKNGSVTVYGYRNTRRYLMEVMR